MQNNDEIYGMDEFNAKLHIIGINPFVYVPEAILNRIFVQAGKSKGPVPIRGLLNGRDYQQTLVKYRGEWRLYVNTSMLKDSPKRIGEEITVSVAYDPRDRTIEPHPKLVKALQENPEAYRVFNSLSPSRKNEIVRYISSLKTEESVDRNIKRAISFLLGEERFIGRDKP